MTSPVADVEDAERQPKPSLLDHMGGMAGLVYSGLPSVAFVVANAAAGPNAAVAIAFGAGAGITVLRLLRKESLQPALSGLFGVAVAAVIAYQTGDARHFFVVGIWLSLALAVAFLISVLVRWPLVGIIWNLLNGAGHAWRDDKVARRAYDVATLAVGHRVGGPPLRQTPHR